MTPLTPTTPGQPDEYGYTWDPPAPKEWISFDTYLCNLIANVADKYITDGISHPSDMTQDSWVQYLEEARDALRAWGSDKFEFNSFEEEAARLEAAKAALHKVADRLGDWWD